MPGNFNDYTTNYSITLSQNISLDELYSNIHNLGILIQRNMMWNRETLLTGSEYPVDEKPFQTRENGVR